MQDEHIHQLSQETAPAIRGLAFSLAVHACLSIRVPGLSFSVPEFCPTIWNQSHILGGSTNGRVHAGGHAFY